MSHIVTCEIKFTNEVAFERSVQILSEAGLVAKDLGEGTHKVWTRTVKGRGVMLEGWRYPAVRDAAGLLTYDNSQGNWGEEAHIDRLAQRYSLESLKMEADLAGLSYTESVTQDGQIDLEVQHA